jgi:methionyl-tRNA formyltransferase
MNILYIGSSGALSLIPFKRLLSAGYTISAIGVYKPIVFNEKVIAIENESLALAASQNNIPLLDLSQPIPKLLEQCLRYSIDIILMSCYGKRLPDDIINIADKGCFNMHPSLLPRFRGPEPIFWQMKAASTLGVSWHRVIHDFDAGDLVIQKKVLSDDGASYLDINVQLADTGAELMIDMLKGLSSGELKSNVQNHEAASYYPYPQQKNFAIDTNWTAQHAYNFMCATQLFGYTYRCQVAKYCYVLKEALDYDHNASLENIEIQSDRLYIPFSEGVLIARYIDRIVA